MLLRIGYVMRCAYYVHESAIPIHTLESAPRARGVFTDPVQMHREGGCCCVLGTSRDVPTKRMPSPSLYTHWSQLPAGSCPVFLIRCRCLGKADALSYWAHLAMCLI